VFWPHTKTSVFFNKHQKKYLRELQIEILKFLTGCFYLLPSPRPVFDGRGSNAQYQLLIEMEKFPLTKHKVLI